MKRIFGKRITFKIRLEFKIQDLWIGIFWKKKIRLYNIWICVIPCFPIHVKFAIWPNYED